MRRGTIVPPSKSTRCALYPVLECPLYGFMVCRLYETVVFSDALNRLKHAFIVSVAPHVGDEIGP